MGFESYFDKLVVLGLLVKIGSAENDKVGEESESWVIVVGVSIM